MGEQFDTEQNRNLYKRNCLTGLKQDYRKDLRKCLRELAIRDTVVLQRQRGEKIVVVIIFTGKPV